MTERYELINREEGHYPTSSMCRWSSVSKSGYYSWRDRPQSQTAIRREELAMMIKDVFERSDGTYGYRRIQVSLERRGVRADGSTIRSIMRDLGLQAAGPRAKVRTTVPAQDLDAPVPVSAVGVLKNVLNDDTELFSFRSGDGLRSVAPGVVAGP